MVIDKEPENGKALEGNFPMSLPCILLHMEHTGILDVENPIHILTLQYVYLRRTNSALSEWMITLYDHPIQIEHSWSPNQMWWNGMMNPCNPFAIGNLDDDPEDLSLYGEVPEGQTDTSLRILQQR